MNALGWLILWVVVGLVAIALIGNAIAWLFGGAR